MPYRVSYGGMLLGEDEKAALKAAIDKNYWPLGEEGKLMEEEAAAFLGVKYGLLANSGSSAGLLALSALELPKGSEVIIPATTFPTIFNIIVQLGLVPVVVDSKIGTYNLDPDELEVAIGPKTRAIICVHAVGNPVDMPKVLSVVDRLNLTRSLNDKLYVLEDNCDGWGGTINGKRVGSFGHISFTSFHAAHIVSMGQGGGVFTDDEQLARNARMYRDWGRQSDIDRRTNGDKWPDLPADQDSRFIYEKIGYNISPLDLQAAMGRVQLKRTEEIKGKRMDNFNYLYEHLSQFEDLVLPKWVEGADPSWFAMPLSYYDRAPLVAHLEANGIETRSMFAGNILRHPAYKDVQHRVGTNLYEANKILESSFWIGVHPRMTQEDREFVVKTFKDYFDAIPTPSNISGLNE